jgi:hypothetical protein
MGGSVNGFRDVQQDRLVGVTMKILLIEDSKFQRIANGRRSSRLGTVLSVRKMARRVSVLLARAFLILFCSI